MRPHGVHRGSIGHIKAMRRSTGHIYSLVSPPHLALRHSGAHNPQIAGLETAGFAGGAQIPPLGPSRSALQTAGGDKHLSSRASVTMGEVAGCSSCWRRWWVVSRAAVVLVVCWGAWWASTTMAEKWLAVIAASAYSVMEYSWYVFAAAHVQLWVSVMCQWPCCCVLGVVGTAASTCVAHEWRIRHARDCPMQVLHHDRIARRPCAVRTKPPGVSEGLHHIPAVVVQHDVDGGAARAVSGRRA